MIVRPMFVPVLCALAIETAAAQSAAPRDTVVKTASAPVHAGTGTIVEELSIGVVDGDEEYMFGDVADIALGNDGSLFVLDRRIPVVRHYDAKGKFIGNVGRMGSGPGEYRSVSGIATLKDGRLALWDTGNWRVNIYSASGEFVAQWQTPSGAANATATYTRAVMVDTAGAVWLRGNVVNGSQLDVTRRAVWFHVDARGIRDTVDLPPMPAPAPGFKAMSRFGTTSAQLPFSPQPIASKSPLGYFVTGFPSRYAFEIHEPGKPLTSIRREGVRPTPVSAEERASEKERIEKLMRGTDPAWTWSGAEVPSLRPYYSAISFGLDGRIWLTVIGEPPPGPGFMTMQASGGASRGGGAPARAPASAPQRGAVNSTTLYDLFEPDGKFVGQVSIPARVSIVLRRGDQIWGVSRNTDDVATVKRYRIRWQ